MLTQHTYIIKTPLH